MAWTFVALLGPRALPGRKYDWSPPCPSNEWAALLERWGAEFDRFEHLAIYERTQLERGGLAVLLIGRGEPVAFLKLQRGARSGLDAESFALERLKATPPGSFHAPELMGRGRLAEWSYVAMTPLRGLHRPARRPPLAVISGEIATALRDLPRAPDVPGHWRPMHGDLTPWNLRRFGASDLALVDWEDVAWGPPGADAVLYRAARAALGGALEPTPDSEEAISFWETRIKARASRGTRDAKLTASLLSALAALRSHRDASSHGVRRT